MLVPVEINMLVSSEADAGAINVSADGSQFEVQLQEPLSIPAEAIGTTISVEEATVWWSVPNIITGENDLMRITYNDGVNPPVTYNITIPQGLYDLTGLNQAIERELTNLSAPTSPTLISLSPDDATQRVELQANYTGVSVDFTIAQSFRFILGFNSAVVGPSTIAPQVYIADNVAQFNSVNYFLIHSDISGKGIRFNNNYNQTIAQVLIDVAPGSQIVSKPFNPARTSAEELNGSRRTNLRMWLTDDVNRPVNTNGETWSARIVIKYFMPYVLSIPKSR